MPTVTVVIPTYNCAEFLGEAIDSLLAQTFRDFEIVVVDDGSTDNTGEVAARYGHLPFFRYIRQTNGGPSKGRNTGIQASTSEFVAFLDGDDLLASDALEKLVTAADESGAAWCICDVVRFSENRREVQTSPIPADRDYLSAILEENFVERGMFFRRSVFERVGPWRADLRTREDWELFIRLIERREPFVYVEAPLYLYRRREGSLTKSASLPVMRDTREVLRRHHLRLAQAGNRAAAAIFAMHAWGLARRFVYEHREWGAAGWCAWHSMRQDFRWERLLSPILHHAPVKAGRGTQP